MFSWLEHNCVTGGQRWGELPDGHEDREVPRDDLAYNAQGFVEVVGDGVFVELGQVAFLRADRRGEVTQVISSQRDVGGEGFTDWLAVVPGFSNGDLFEIFIDTVGHCVQDCRAFCRAGFAPRGRCFVSCVEG